MKPPSLAPLLLFSVLGSIALAAKLTLLLPDHNNLTAFRNIWVRPLSLPAAN